MPPAPPLPPVTVVLDRHDDTLHTHTAPAAARRTNDNRRHALFVRGIRNDKLHVA